MKKLPIIFLSIFILLTTSCINNNTNINDEYGMYKITIVNNTNEFVRYTFVNGYTSSTNGVEFYNSTYNYVNNYWGQPIYDNLLCPYGSIKDDLLLYQSPEYLKKQNYNITVFVCKSNTYNNKPREYIGKGTFYITGDRTITISPSGQVY